MQTGSDQDHVSALQQLQDGLVNGIVTWCGQNPVLAAAVGIGLVLLILLVLPRVARWYCRTFRINWIFGDFAQDHRDGQARGHKHRDKRISTLPGPIADPPYLKMALPQELDSLAAAIESCEQGDRFRYCVVCQEKNAAENYARLFFHRIKESAALNRYGWVYYQKPRDKGLDLCIENCFFESLNLHTEIQVPRDRFAAQVGYFDEPTRHTLLVISMAQNKAPNDQKLGQIAALNGLSVILVGTKPVSGYSIIDISQKGGER